MVPPSGVELFLRGRALDPGSRGFAGREDAPAAARLYRQAAGLGHVPALVNLALMLEEGRGVPRDLAQAGQCYRAAAEAGDPLARQYLAEGQFGPAAPPLWLEPEIYVTDGALRTVLRGWREWSCQLAEELRRVWVGTFTYRRTVLRGSWTAWERAIERVERRSWCERQLGRARTKRWRRYLALWRTGMRDESILDRLSEHQLSRARNRRCQRGWDSWRDQAEAGAARDDLVARHRENRRDWAVERCWDQWWVGAQLAGGLDRASETHLARRRLNQLAACWSVWAVQAHQTRAAVHWCVVQLHRGWKRFRWRQARLQALDAETHWLACRLIGAVARWRMLVGQQQSQASRLEMHWRAVLLWAVRRMTLAMQQWQWVVQSLSGAGQLEDRAALLWSVDRMALAMRRWGLLCAGFWIRYGFGCWQAIVEQARKVRLGVVRLTLMLVGELPSSRGGPRPLAGSESKHLWSDQLLGLGCERLGMVVAALVGVLVPSAALGVAEGHGRSIDCIMRPWKAAVTVTA